MGNIGYTELVFVLILWGLPIALAVWFVRVLNGIARAQRDMADSLRRLEDRLGQGGRNSGSENRGA